MGATPILFFAKVPQKWSCFFKKIHVFFITLGGGGGVRRNVTNVKFFFFLFEGFSYALIHIINTYYLHHSKFSRKKKAKQ